MTTKTWFGFPDIHFPDQEEEALEVAMAAHRHFKPDYSIVGNDLVNCTPFSSWGAKSIPEATARDWFQDEVTPAIKFVDKVQANTNIRTYYLPGNHDCWVERWCARNGRVGQAIYSMVSLKVNLSRGRKHFTYIDVTNPRDRRNFVKMHHDLYCVHGWSYCKHAAAKHLELSRTRSVIFNHTHRMQVFYGRDPWNGKPIFAASAGCLCKKQPMYMHDGKPTDWVNGFWIAFVGRTDFTFYPITIHKGRAIMPDGKEIKLI